jgi:hypothetical protein
VTEQEIQRGVFTTKGNVDAQCLCYVRIIEDINENLSHSLAWRFIDLIDNENIDGEAQAYLRNLRDDKVRNALHASNIFE